MSKPMKTIVRIWQEMDCVCRPHMSYECAGRYRFYRPLLRHRAMSVLVVILVAEG